MSAKNPRCIHACYVKHPRIALWSIGGNSSQFPSTAWWSYMQLHPKPSLLTLIITHLILPVSTPCTLMATA